MQLLRAVDKSLGIQISDESKLLKKLERVIPLLDERQKRLFVAAEADQIGYGGITLLARLTGMSRVSIHSGLADLGAELKGQSSLTRRRPQAHDGHFREFSERSS